MDFNLEFEHYLFELFWGSKLEQESSDKFLFLLELCLFESTDILF